jgi:hypothetical protein
LILIEFVGVRGRGDIGVGVGVGVVKLLYIMCHIQNLHDKLFDLAQFISQSDAL